MGQQQARAEGLLGPGGLEGQLRAFVEAPDGQGEGGEDQCQQRQTEVPAEAVGHQQQAAAAEQHADLVAAHLQAVAQTAPAFGQQAHGETVGGDVLSGGGKVHHQQHAEQQDELAAEQLGRIEQGQAGQTQHHQTLQRQNPATVMAQTG